MIERVEQWSSVFKYRRNSFTRNSSNCNSQSDQKNQSRYLQDVDCRRTESHGTCENRLQSQCCADAPLRTIDFGTCGNKFKSNLDITAQKDRHSATRKTQK